MHFFGLNFNVVLGVVYNVLTSVRLSFRYDMKVNTFPNTGFHSGLRFIPDLKAGFLIIANGGCDCMGHHSDQREAWHTNVCAPCDHSTITEPQLGFSYMKVSDRWLGSVDTFSAIERWLVIILKPVVNYGGTAI